MCCSISINMLLTKLTCLCLFLLLLEAESSPAKGQGRILFFAPWLTKSISIKMMPLITGLAGRGHGVVLVMPFCQDCGEHENITVMHVKEYNDTFFKNAKAYYLDPLMSSYERFTKSLMMYQGILECIDNAAVQPELSSHLDQGFDVVISFNTIAGPEVVGKYLAQRSNASLVLYATGQGPTSRVSQLIGQPYHPAYMNQPAAFALEQLTFSDRVFNMVMTIFMDMFGHYLAMSQEWFLSKSLPEKAHETLVKSQNKKVNLVMHTGHPLLDGVRPVVPNFQYVGCVHCRPGKSLPPEFKEFMERSFDKGVILFSFGTFERGEGLPSSFRKMMLEVFSKLEQNVIWKWEGNHTEGLPTNVMVSKWVPQQDILAHPSTKLFVSHVGQSSLQEALYHGKPVVAIPIAFDQPYYGHKVESLGVGRSIRYSELTKDNLFAAITEVLKNSSFTKNARRLGTYLRDEMLSPSAKAIWWIEYVMRNKENYLESPILNLNWYQYFLIDAILFLSLSLGVLGLTAYFILKRICFANISLACNRKKKLE